MARMSQPWQLRALTYYDQIGEIRFASQFYAKLLSRVRYYPALQLEDGKTEPIESGPPVELLHRIQDPGGGRSRLQYEYGRMMGITGEGVLFGDRLGTDGERWRFLWKDEVRPSDSGEGWQRVRYDMTPYDPPELGQAYRFWTPHPRHSDLPDSPLHSVLDIAEELLILTASVMGTATTRMTNGILIIPTEASPNSYGTLEDDDYLGDEDPENNAFLSDMMEHIQAQIEDPGSAASKVPPVLEAAYEYVDRVRWMQTHDPQTDYDGWQNVVVAFDDSQVVIPPDRTEAANNALDRIAIGFKAYREMIGVGEDTAPTEEEKEFLASLKLRQPVEFEDGDLIIPQRGPLAQTNGNSPEDGPPNPNGGRDGSRQEARTASAEILGAASLALLRCRELAGIRIRHKCSDCAEGHADSVVASVLGQEEVADPQKLVKGGTDGFKSWLEDQGFEVIQSQALGQQLELWAARTLFQPRCPDLPSGFVAAVEKAKEVPVDAVVDSRP